MRGVGNELEPVAEAELLGPFAVGRAEVADEARDRVQLRVGERLQERTRVAAAEEAPRVRDREPLAAPVLEPGEVVEVAAVRNRRHGRGRLERARLVRDRVGRGDDRVRRVGDEPGDAGGGRLLRPHGQAVGAPVRVGGDRVAQVGHPANAGQPLDRRADQVDRVRGRRRDHCVDPLALDDSRRRRDRGQVPADVLVGHEQASPEQPDLRREALEALGAVKLVRRPLAGRPDVLRAMDPRLRRRDELVVPVHPLGVVRGEDMRLDPVARQMRRQLERPLDASAAGRREVQGDEQDLHAGSMVVGRGSRKMRIGSPDLVVPSASSRMPSAAAMRREAAFPGRM